MVSENIHAHPIRKNLKEIWGSKPNITSVGEVWIFSGTTLSVLVYEIMK